MKTLKTTSMNVFMSLLMVLILFPACSQSSKKSSEKAAMEKPEMDIHSAVMADNLGVVKKYIALNRDLNLKDNFSGSSPLNNAAVFGRTKIAKALIDAGADLSIKNNDGSTPLHTAAFFGRVEIVQLLLDANADKTLKNNFGATPREIVSAKFSDMKPVYEMMQQQLAPLGLQLDLNELQKNRPVIAMMLE